MAIAHLSYVICDICGAPAAQPEDNARRARRAADRAGFTSIIREHDLGRVKARHDYCPKHAPATRENSSKEQTND